MTRLLVLFFALLVGLIPLTANAAAPTLQVAPLQYETRLEPGKVHQGFIDVSNPADSEVNIVSTVQGFRQIGTDGNLEFYTDPDLSNAIKPGLTDFSIGPCEAVRVVFTVDASKLPQGGTYAAIFFRTDPGDSGSGASHIRQSANVGTLLLLSNGEQRPVMGEVTGVNLPFWQFGNGLQGKYSYRNTDQTPGGIAVRPKLQLKIFPWSKTRTLDTGLVMPGSTRKFELAREGSFLGPLPITIRDTDTGRDTTRWVFAVTGWCKWFVVVVAVVGFLLLPVPKHWRKTKAPAPIKRSIDGIG